MIGVPVSVVVDYLCTWCTGSGVVGRVVGWVGCADGFYFDWGRVNLSFDWGRVLRLGGTDG